MDKLTPSEAWADFWHTTGQHIKPRTVDLRAAYQAAKGIAKKKDGQPVVMSAERIEKLMREHAPGEYTLHTYFTKNETPATT